MAYQHRPDTGTFGQNTKRTSDKSPDYTGRLIFSKETLQALLADAQAGKEPMAFLAGWKKEGKDGSTFMSLAVSLPTKKTGQQSKTNRDDDIPF